MGTEERRIKETAWRWEKQEPGSGWSYQSELKGAEEQETFVFLIYEAVFYIYC